MRIYHSNNPNTFTDVLPIYNIFKEYDCNKKKLMKIVLPNGSIQNYSLYNGYLK